MTRMVFTFVFRVVVPGILSRNTGKIGTEIHSDDFKNTMVCMRRQGGQGSRVRDLAFVATIRTTNCFPARTRQRSGSRGASRTGSRTAVEGREAGRSAAKSGTGGAATH